MTDLRESYARTFKVDSPLMHGDDIRKWQSEIIREFARMSIICPIKADGVWGIASRSYNASLCHAIGMNASEVMRHGVTPDLRISIRNRRLTKMEESAYRNRQEYRRNLRDRYESSRIVGVARPVTKIIEDSWGYHPGQHDGTDVICPDDAKLFAMVKAKVIDVRSGGWWGKAPSGDVSKGDGIIQLEVLDDVGPFTKGYHIGYGHAEKAVVRVGDIVFPHQHIGSAGMAVVSHIHLMYNTGKTHKGIGNLDSRKILDYAVKHG